MFAMRAAPILLFLLAACSGGGGGSPGTPAAPAPPTPPITTPAGLVSIGTPFATGCGGTGSGTVYVNAEVEPSLAVDPLDANHLVASWQQDRWSNGSARGIMTAVTFDGGTTWSYVQVPFSQCSGGNAGNGGNFQRATDPWLSFGPAGTVYQSVLSTSGGSFQDGSANALLVSRSTDGGRTWSNPVAAMADTGAFFNDKEAITADPRDARYAYLAWDRLQQAVGGATWFARTSDGGATWEPARQVYDPGRDRQTIANLVRVLPDGTLVLMFLEIVGNEDQPQTAAVRVMRSPDKGTTWSAPITVSSSQPLGTRDPATSRGVRDGSIVPQMAVGADGILHVVWQDGRFSGTRDAIAYARSTDGGLTWSPPVRVNGAPNVAAFLPQVHVRADGVVGVTYYDFRSDTADPATLPTDYWLARSVDGVSWTEQRVAGPFDLTLAPLSGDAYFMGDYMGLGSAGSAFLSLHIRTTGDAANRTDVYLTRVDAGPKRAAAQPLAAARLVERDAAFAERVSGNLRASLDRRSSPP